MDRAKIEFSVRMDLAKTQSDPEQSHSDSFRKVAQNYLARGDGSALTLADRYFAGTGVSTNEYLAREILREYIHSERMVRPMEAYRLAEYELAGGDTATGMQILRQLQEHQYPPAFCRVGRQVEKLSTPTSIEEARSLYRRASELGSVRADILLARSYIQSRGHREKITGVLMLLASIPKLLRTAAASPKDYSKILG